MAQSTPEADPTSPATAARPVAHQVAWVTAGRIMAAGLQAVLLVLAARTLPVSEFGLFTAYLGIVTLAQAFSDCGVIAFMSRERAAHPTSGAVATSLRFTSFSAAVVVVVSGGGLAVAAALISPTFWPMLPLAIAAAGERNADSRLAVAFADGDVHVSMYNLVARRISAIVLFLALERSGLDPLLSFSTAAAVAAVGSATFANLYIRRRVTTPSDLSYRDLLRKARAFWLTSIAVQARNLDAVLVASLAGGTQAGLYSSGSRLIGPLQLVPSALASVLLPASARSRRSRAAVGRLLKVSTVVVAGLCVVYAGLFLAAPVLVERGLGPRYAGAETVIRIILVGLPFSSAGSLLTAILQGQGRARAVATSWTVSTTVCLLGVAVVAPFEGANGAAAVLSLSFAVQFVALSSSLRKVWRDLPDLPDETSSAGVSVRSGGDPAGPVS